MLIDFWSLDEPLQGFISISGQSYKYLASVLG